MAWSRPSPRGSVRPVAQVFDHACLAAFLAAVAIVLALIGAAAWLSFAGREDDPKRASDRDEAVAAAAGPRGPAAPTLPEGGR
jgi:hypothetical protein